MIVNYGMNMLWEGVFSLDMLVLSHYCQSLLTHVSVTRKGTIPFSKIKKFKIESFAKQSFRGYLVIFQARTPSPLSLRFFSIKLAIQSQI